VLHRLHTRANNGELAHQLFRLGRVRVSRPTYIHRERERQRHMGACKPTDTDTHTHTTERERERENATGAIGAEWAGRRGRTVMLS
jgi:hypothetical protein